MLGIESWSYQKRFPSVSLIYCGFIGGRVDNFMAMNPRQHYTMSST